MKLNPLVNSRSPEFFSNLAPCSHSISNTMAPMHHRKMAPFNRWYSNSRLLLLFRSISKYFLTYSIKKCPIFIITMTTTQKYWREQNLPHFYIKQFKSNLWPGFHFRVKFCVQVVLIEFNMIPKNAAEDWIWPLSASLNIWCGSVFTLYWKDTVPL